MSTIRRQSIISSLVVYFGFAIGAFNTYLFTRKGGFTPEQYGLTGMFMAVASIMYAIANLGIPSYISKFFPYYKEHLPNNKNDQLAIALIIPTVGFLFVVVSGLAFKNILIDKVFNNSPQLLQYYYWIFPFGFGLTIFSIMEAFALQNRKAVLTNFLREVLFRLCTTALILLTVFGVFSSFDIFVKSYAFVYALLALILIFYFISQNNFPFTFSISRLTSRLFNKIITLCSFVWMGGLVFTIVSFFDTIVIAAVLPNGLAYAGIFTLGQYIASIIQAPQRGVVSAAIGPLSQAWREKDYKKIDAIYHRSSINQLIFSLFIFCLILLNFKDGIKTFNLKDAFLQAETVFLFIGLTRVIDMGTGVNAQIIGTSTFWRFEFLTGLILFAISLPLYYILTRQLGIIGPAITNLIAFTIYNAIRYYFLLKRFKMQPFTLKTLYAVLLAVACYAVCYFAFSKHLGFGWIVLRSTVFTTLFAGGVVLLKLTPDLGPVLETIKKKLGLGN